MFSAETTGQIFTKILHHIVASVALFYHAYTRRYPIPFLNARAISAMAVGNFVTKLVAMATSLDESEKLDLIKKNSLKYLPFGEKIVKIGPVDTEIALLRVKKKKKLTQAKYIAGRQLSRAG